MYRLRRRLSYLKSYSPIELFNLLELFRNRSRPVLNGPGVGS